MDKTENVEKVEMTNSTEEAVKKFSLLVLLASILSIGSLIWSTWSFIDLYDIKTLSIEWLGGVSLIALSAAITMDIVWSATTVAEYQGMKLPVSWYSDKKKRRRTVNFLPVIGWIEVLFVAALLGYHGSTMEGGAAAFAAALPIFTKLTWMLALSGLKDPTELTDEEKAQMAAKKRKSRLTRADAEATAEQHEANMILKEREHEATLAEERRKAAIEHEKVQAQIAREKLERDAKFEAEKAELEGANQIKAMRQRLNSQLQIETMRNQAEITMERMDAEQDMMLRTPFSLHRSIQGQVVPQSRPQLPKGDASFDEEGSDFEEYEVSGAALSFEGMGLTPAQEKRATLAARYHAVNYSTQGRVTKAAFCEANNNMNPPRLSEATRDFPVEWFVENNKAVWM